MTVNMIHLGCKLVPGKSSVAYIHQNRDNKVFEKVFQLMLQHLGFYVGSELKNLRRLKRETSWWMP
jgi:hypothetical protein